MKKSLIALAVAGVFAAPAFATTGNVDVYGKVRMSVDHANISGANNGGWQMSDRVSRVGLKGTEDLGGGLKAVWQIEQQMTIDGTNTAASTSTATVQTAGVDGIMGTVDDVPAAVTTTTTAAPGNAFGGAGLRNTFVGLNGDFGTVLIGRHDTPYKLAGSADLFADTIADSQCAGGGAGGACIIGRGGFDTRAKEILAYISPTWGGFSFSAGVMPGEELNLTGAAAAAANDADGLMDAYSLGGSYTNGPIKVTAAYENIDGKASSLAVGTNSDKASWKINGGYKIGDVGLGLTYEKSDDAHCAAAVVTCKEDTGILASVSYGMGPITLSGQYGKYDQKDTGATKNMDLTSWIVGATYALSKRTNVYALYHSNNWGSAPVIVNPDVKHWSFGVNHDF